MVLSSWLMSLQRSRVNSLGGRKQEPRMKSMWSWVNVSLRLSNHWRSKVSSEPVGRRPRSCPLLCQSNVLEHFPGVVHGLGDGAHIPQRPCNAQHTLEVGQVNSCRHFGRGQSSWPARPWSTCRSTSRDHFSARILVGNERVWSLCPFLARLGSPFVANGDE